MRKASQITDALRLGFPDNQNILSLIKKVREGIKYTFFLRIVNVSPFTMQEWSVYLDLTERTMQRYQKEKKTFDRLQSEKILEITILNKKGSEVFGNKDSYNKWLDSKNIALGGVKPKELLDNSFGIQLLKDELLRIEHGVLA
ncbi:MAG: antitoxin Xre/MbcA/ParS toxin-binding domain-containing protein [Bacteroidia bacterium]